jgi:ribosomal protein L16/L10AE
MPEGNRPDVGKVPGRTWEEALRIGEAETKELLREGTYNSSVHLSLYLEWAAEELRQRNVEAAEELRQRNVEAQAGLELGRHILNFLR